MKAQKAKTFIASRTFGKVFLDPRDRQCPARGLFVGGALCVAAALSGCTARPDSSPQASLEMARQFEAIRRRRSAGQKPEKVDPNVAALQKAWGRWVQEITHPRTPGTGKISQGPHPVVSIDVAAIAARHPAWRLAQMLENNPGLRLTFAQLQALRLGSVAPLGPLQVAPAGGVAGYARAAQPVTASGLPGLQEQARQKQTLDRFVGQAANRLAANRAARAISLRAASDKNIEITRRPSLDELDPSLLSDPLQLRISNLRLQLLQNLQSSKAEKEQARRELRSLEDQWETQLRRQTAARRAELQKLLNQKPDTPRNGGQDQIEAALIAAQQADAALLEAVAQRHDANVQSDFAAVQSRLSIVLPRAALPAQQLQGLPGRTTSSQNGRAARTSIPGSTSSGRNLSSLSAASVSLEPRGERAAQIRALRAQARKDAQRWASVAARRAGWIWQEQPGGAPNRPLSSNAPAPDRTREALRILHLS